LFYKQGLLNSGFFKKFAGRDRFLGLKMGVDWFLSEKKGQKLAKNCKKLAKVRAF